MKSRHPFAFLLALALVALAIQSLTMLPATAAEFRSARDNTVATNAVVAFPGQAGRQILLKSFDVVGNNADVKLQILSGTLVTATVGENTGEDNEIGLARTNGFGVGQGVVMVQRRGGTKTTTAHFYSSVNGSAVIINGTLGDSVQSGDLVWWASDAFTNAIGSATVRLQGDIWAADPGAPLFLRLFTVAGSSVAINSATVEYTRFP